MSSANGGAPLRVAFQGELGAFSEEAVRLYFGESVVPMPCRTFADVGRAVARGDADFGLLPVENTLAGSVVATFDVLGSEDLEVVGEVIVPIHHCVLGVPGATLKTVQRVYSHPVALAQCARFFAEHPQIEAVASYDTAGAAKEVADRGEPTEAALAGRAAAERYGLVILAANVEDRHDNQTRFLVVKQTGAETPLPRRGGDDGDAERKTALLVETENTPGALVRVLLPFANRGINLAKLESRPADEPWTYRFFMELETDAASPDARDALEEVRRRATALRSLGTYPRWRPR